MANHKSAEKRARVSARRNDINTQTMARVRTLEKQVRKAITAKDKDQSAKALVAFESGIAKAAQKGRVPTRTASRKVSRLSKAIASL